MRASVGLDYFDEILFWVETGPQSLRTLFLFLFLFLGFLLLSDFRFPKALSFINRSL